MAWEHDIAWLAGFLDGEGCFEIARRSADSGLLRPSLSVTQKDRQPLDKVVRLVGGSLSKDGRGYWRWTLTSRDTLLFILSEMIEHLTLKKKQAKVLLAFCETIGTRGVNYTKNQRQARELLASQIRGLK